MLRISVVVPLVLLALAPPSLAQQGQYSAIQGRISDESRLALPGVTVVVTHQESGMFRQVVSNADGFSKAIGALSSANIGAVKALQGKQF